MKKRLVALAVLAALGVAACGGDDDDTTAEPAAEPAADPAAEPATEGVDSSKPTIKLIVNPWSASRLNVEVAKNLIENELGYPVEIIEVNENDAMFTGMADGSLDAVLEIWPSGVTDAEQAYFDDGTVNNIGELGAVGKIGWFVPRFVIDEHPELATWEGYTTPEAAALFATAETGDQGRFLGTDPSYSQYDEQIIDNLGLPFQVQFSGSEPATVAEVDARVSAGEPIVLYWWTPTAAVAKYDLVNVALPAYTDECGASAAAGDGGVDCDYPEDVLFKAASAKLQDKAPDVYAFLQKFTISTDDQLEMLPPMEIDGDDPAAVAAAWVAAHGDVWSTWLG
ncbi:MAG TPA: glycine betaine ABC transporter substrate-binding protein [Ilumatobacter sp.]|nr:glycine betaine ABC transporter substrate-binding protein [Ilumatobacter sp.]